MTELTEQQKIDRIAEGVMGWKKSWIGPSLGWFNDKGFIIHCEDFNPFHSWQDAGKVLEKMREKTEKIQEIFSQEIHEKIGHPLYPMPIANLTPAIISEAALATLEEKWI